MSAYDIKLSIVFIYKINIMFLYCLQFDIQMVFYSQILEKPFLFQSILLGP